MAVSVGGTGGGLQVGRRPTWLASPAARRCLFMFGTSIMPAGDPDETTETRTEISTETNTETGPDETTETCTEISTETDTETDNEMCTEIDT